VANPALWITTEYLQRQVDNPELTDAQVLQLHGCVWAATETTWIAPEDWSRRVTDRALEKDAKIVVGFDGSARRDSTVLTAATLDGFPPPDTRLGTPRGCEGLGGVRQRMAAACGRFRADVLEGTLTHDGGEVLARHVGHCVSKTTPYGT
jgi:hypothetical protein